MGAASYWSTTVDKISKQMRIRLKDGGEINFNLEGPGVVVRTYKDGALKHVTIPVNTAVTEVYFYPQDRFVKEKVALIQSFNNLKGIVVLHGPTKLYDEEGNLVLDENWDAGLLNGKWRRLSKLGMVLEERQYHMGFPIKTWTSYYPNGKKSSQITFPQDMNEWKATELEGTGESPGSLYSADYYHPFRTQEVWYSEDGVKQKEIHYEMIKEGRFVSVLGTGKADSYTPYGKLSRRLRIPQGTGNDEHFYQHFDQQYLERKTWFNDEIFKTVSLSGPLVHDEE